MRPAFVLAAFLSVTPCSLACTCGSPSPVCSAYWQSPVVFRGKVIGQELVSPPETAVKNLDGSTSTLHHPGFYRVRFSVFETSRRSTKKKPSSSQTSGRAKPDDVETGPDSHGEFYQRAAHYSRCASPTRGPVLMKLCSFACKIWQPTTQKR